MNPLISIIIPTFNRATLIIETLNSVKNQSYVNWECIIIDDGSTDDTASVINNFIHTDVRFLFKKRNEIYLKGPSSCRNIGISLAKGTYVMFLDSDDLLDKFCLENRIKCVNENKMYDLYIFKTQVFYDKIENLGNIFNMSFDKYSDENYLKSFVRDNYPFCILSVLWVTEKIKLIGGFDENLLVLEDPDLHINAFSKGLKSFTEVAGLPDTFYRKSLENVSPTVESKLKHIRSKIFFYKKYLPIFKNEMGNLPVTFFRVYVLDYGSFLDVFRYYLLFLLNRIFSVWQAIFIPILLFYKLFNLDKIRGLGFHKLSVILLKKI